MASVIRALVKRSYEICIPKEVQIYKALGFFKMSERDAIVAVIFLVPRKNNSKVRVISQEIQFKFSVLWLYAQSTYVQTEWTILTQNN